MRGFRLQLTDNQCDQLRRAERSHPSARVRWRARLVLACAKAPSLLQVAQSFDCCWRTVKAAVHRYQTGGLAALADVPRSGRPPKVKAALRQKLTGVLQAQPQAAGLAGYRWTAQQVRLYLARHQAAVSLTTAWRELRRCGRVRKRAKHYTPSPDPYYHRKKGNSSALAARPFGLQAAPSGWYADESQIELLPVKGDGYGERGKPLRVQTPGRNRKLHLFLAATWWTGKIRYHFYPRRRSEEYHDFEARLARAGPLLLGLDNSNIHSTQAAREPAKGVERHFLHAHLRLVAATGRQPVWLVEAGVGQLRSARLTRAAWAGRKVTEEAPEPSAPGGAADGQPGGFVIVHSILKRCIARPLLPEQSGSALLLGRHIAG